VALGFALAESTVLVYISFRNRFFDRANALFHLPVVGQELIQALLWPHVGQEGELCNTTNRRLSFLIVIVVIGLPFYASVLAKALQALLVAAREVSTPEQLRKGLCPGGHRLVSFDTDLPKYYCSVCGHEDLPLRTRMWGCRTCDFDACALCFQEGVPCIRFKAKVSKRARSIYVPLILGRQPLLWAACVPRRLKRKTHGAILSTSCFLFGACLYMRQRIYGEWLQGSVFEGARCTFRGPYGHQVWPMMSFPSGRWGLKLFSAGLYMTLGGGFALIPKPGYICLALNVLAVAATVMYLTMGDEWGSVWCWMASCLCFLYIVEPFLFHYFRVFDPEVIDGPRRPARREHLGFLIARIHFHDEMMPWPTAADTTRAPVFALDSEVPKQCDRMPRAEERL